MGVGDGWSVRTGDAMVTLSADGETLGDWSVRTGDAVVTLGADGETLGDWSVRTGDAVVTLLSAQGDTLLVNSESTEDKSTMDGAQYSTASILLCFNPLPTIRNN